MTTREDNSSCYSYTKKEIRRLRNDSKLALNQRVKKSVYRVESYTIPSEVVSCPILYCIDVFSTYLGKILDFVVVHWSFIFVSHVSRLIVEFI